MTERKPDHQIGPLSHTLSPSVCNVVCGPLCGDSSSLCHACELMPTWAPDASSWPDVFEVWFGGPRRALKEDLHWKQNRAPGKSWGIEVEPCALGLFASRWSSSDCWVRNEYLKEGVGLEWEEERTNIQVYAAVTCLTRSTPNAKTLFWWLEGKVYFWQLEGKALSLATWVWKSYLLGTHGGEGFWVRETQ